MSAFAAFITTMVICALIAYALDLYGKINNRILSREINLADDRSFRAMSARSVCAISESGEYYDITRVYNSLRRKSVGAITFDRISDTLAIQYNVSKVIVFLESPWDNVCIVHTHDTFKVHFLERIYRMNSAVDAQSAMVD